jgi:hypothetical protein
MLTCMEPVLAIVAEGECPAGKVAGVESAVHNSYGAAK